MTKQKKRRANGKISEEKTSVLSVTGIFLSALIFGLPLVYTNGYYNITETKSGFYYGVSIVFLFVTLIFSIIRFSLDKKGENSEKVSLRLYPMDTALLVFGFFVLMSGILSQYQSDVWLGGASRYQGVITVLLYIAVYFAVSRNYSFSQLFLIAAIVSFSLVCIIAVLNCFNIDLLGIYKYIPAYYKTMFISTIGNINFYSSYLCLIFPLVLCGFCSTREILSRVIYTCALVIGACGMVVSGSESFVIGFVFSVLIFPFFLMKDSEKLKKFLIGVLIILMSAQLFRLVFELVSEKNSVIARLMEFILSPVVTALIFVICISIIFVLHKFPEKRNAVKLTYYIAFAVFMSGIILLFILANTRGLGELDIYFRFSDSWGSYRGGIWKQCIEVYSSLSVKDKLFGVGIESAYRVLQDNLMNSGLNLDQAHNEYLQYLLTTGVFGLISYLGVIITTVVTVVKNQRNNTFVIALLCGLIAFWFQGLVNIAQPFTTPIMYVFISMIGGQNLQSKF